MITIYHNPRCSKSRQGLAILKESGKEFTVVKYLDDNLNEKQLYEIVKLLNISPIDLVRKDEKIWKENFKDKELNDSQIITAMVENHKLIERPIVVNNKKAIVGRPPERIKDIL